MYDLDRKNRCTISHFAKTFYFGYYRQNHVVQCVNGKKVFYACPGSIPYVYISMLDIVVTQVFIVYVRIILLHE